MEGALAGIREMDGCQAMEPGTPQPHLANCQFNPTEMER
jgi:hypothetical protein